MIVEVRSYLTKVGRRDEFITFFETRAIPAQRSYGIRVLGPLLDLENPERFIWLRVFPTPAERDRMKEAFYGGELWKNELEGIALPMLESTESVLCETSADVIV